MEQSTYQCQILGDKITFAPFDFLSQQFLGSLAYVETEGFQRWAHLVWVATWLALNSGTGHILAIVALTNEAESHSF